MKGAEENPCSDKRGLDTLTSSEHWQAAWHVDVSFRMARGLCSSLAVVAYLFILRQGLMNAWLVSDSLHSSKWPWASDPCHRFTRPSVTAVCHHVWVSWPVLFCFVLKNLPVLLVLCSCMVHSRFYIGLFFFLISYYVCFLPFISRAFSSIQLWAGCSSSRLGNKTARGFCKAGRAFPENGSRVSQMSAYGHLGSETPWASGAAVCPVTCLSIYRRCCSRLMGQWEKWSLLLQRGSIFGASLISQMSPRLAGMINTVSEWSVHTSW